MFETLPVCENYTIAECGDTVYTEKALHTYANHLLQGDNEPKGGNLMHKTYKNLADLLLNCDSAQKFYNNLPLHSKLEVKEKGAQLQTESALRSLAKTISEQ